MNNEEKLAKLNKNYKIAQWSSYGIGALWFGLQALPLYFDQKWILSSSLLAMGIGAGVYSSVLKRQVQSLEYRTLTESIENAQIAAIEAAAKQGAAKSRAAKAMSGDTVAEPFVALQNLPQSTDPEIRSFTTIEQIDQQTALATATQKNMTLGANICLGIGIFAGICGFVLPLAACANTVTSIGAGAIGSAITAFFTTLFLCIGVGVAFGIAAATMRSRARAASNRIHELKLQGLRVKASNPRG